MVDTGAEKIKQDTTEPRICAHCLFENRPDALYCGNCGAHLIGKPCPACKALNPDNALYCDNCGTWLDKPAQLRPLYALNEQGWMRPSVLLVALAIVVLAGAVILFGLALWWPSPISGLLGLVGLGLSLVGLVLIALAVTLNRAGHSR